MNEATTGKKGILLETGTNEFEIVAAITESFKIILLYLFKFLNF